ncbi:MAG: phospholipase [Acidobacteria bacterium]|nr:phospholipase [Acidobacteriota bacterium]
MWTLPDLPLRIDGVSAATLRLLATACRSGQLVTPLTAFAASKVASCAPALAADLERLNREGMSPHHIALLLDVAATAVEARLEREAAAELVWSGPETEYARSRDTRVVLDELFSSATRSVLVSTYIVQHIERVFSVLAARLDAVPALSARIFMNVERKPGDTRLEASLLHEFASSLARWPGARRPEIYYDPRGMSVDPDRRASWHAKCVLVDDQVAFVTSANFTEWAQERNVEAGALIRSRHFASQLRLQFDSLVRSKAVKRLPGF